MTRLRSRSKPARPSIWRLSILKVDVAFDFAGAVGQGEAVSDGLLVGADAGGEGVQVGLVAGFDCGEPVFQVQFAGAAGHHLGEAGHMAGEGVQVRAPGQDRGELVPFVWLKVFGPGQQPFGDLAGFGHDGGWWRRGGPLAERPHVAAYGPGAAAPAAGLQLGVQDRGAGDPFRSTAGSDRA